MMLIEDLPAEIQTALADLHAHTHTERMREYRRQFLREQCATVGDCTQAMGETYAVLCSIRFLSLHRTNPAARHIRPALVDVIAQIVWECNIASRRQQRLMGASPRELDLPFPRLSRCRRRS